MNNNELQNISKNKRNSLIEFYRFLFAMWVIWYHGFFIFKNQNFNSGYIAVEFFFILSGFYILKSIDKYKDKPFFSGIFQLLWKRIKALGLPFMVGLIFVFWFMILDKEITFFGYLWYIPFMLLAFGIIYFLRRLTKKEWLFVLTLTICVVGSYLFLYIPIISGYGFFRALGGVSLGVLLSYIPKISLTFKNFNFNWLITLLLFATTVYLAYLPKDTKTIEVFLVLLLIPLLIYFTTTLKASNKFLNFLGSLSFGLYAYQCVVRVIEFYFILPQYWLFIILICLTLLDKVILTTINYIKRK